MEKKTNRTLAIEYGRTVVIGLEFRVVSVYLRSSFNTYIHHHAERIGVGNYRVFRKYIKNATKPFTFRVNKPKKAL